MRFCHSLMLLAAVVCSAGAARAQAGVLLAADDPTQIAKLSLAQVMAPHSTRWLSVRLIGRARVALISSANLETVSSGDAWLRALDYVTRERVAAPPGPLSVCGGRSEFALADSGQPEPASLPARPALTVSSDLELQRALANVGIELSLPHIAEFSAHDPGPYQVVWFDGSNTTGATAAVRWLEQGASNELPQLHVVDRDAVPIDLIALATGAVSPSAGGEADASEFAVSYLALSGTSNYATARSLWHDDHPDTWLAEAVNTGALFDDTVLAGEGAIPSAVTRYFSGLSGSADRASACVAQVERAHLRGSSDSADFACAGADDLARAESELDFGDIRLTRLFGELSAPSTFAVGPGAQQNPRIQATDFETKGCAPPAGTQSDGTTSPGTAAPGGRTGTGMGAGPFSANGSAIDTSIAQPSGPDEGGASIWVDSSDDSCNGDSSPSSSDSSSRDACSGDSSSGNSSDDSCSGDSSSDGAKDDSCSGDSDSSSKDSSGCGSDDKSGYDGDTCSGNSARSTSQTLKKPHGLPKHRLRLSLFMLLGAGLSLPLRRGLK